MTDTTTAWLVYDHQEHKWLKEFTHPTNYVDEASGFSREGAEKLVADVADCPWVDGRPPRTMIPDTRDEYEHLGLEGQAKAMWKLVEAAIAQMAADRKPAVPLPDTTFFEADKTYIRDEPFKAPELLDVFRCVHVAANPRNGEPRAFGFGGTALFRDADWYSTALTPESWADGWVEFVPERVCDRTAEDEIAEEFRKLRELEAAREIARSLAPELGA